MHEDQPALAAAVSGDQWRAVLQPQPGLVAEPFVGLGQHLAADRDLVAAGQAIERAGLRDRPEMLRLGPCQRAADMARAMAQPHRPPAVAGQYRKDAGRERGGASLY